MIPDNLLDRANLVFREMGGYEEASKYISDADIIDTCLFFGDVIIYNPKSTAILEGQEEFAEVFTESFNTTTAITRQITEYLDLSEYGCKDGSLYFVLDANFKAVYRSKTKKIKHQGKSGCYFGSNREDAWVAEQKHGTIFYIQVSADKAPILIKVIINSLLSKEDYLSYVRTNESTVQEPMRGNELVVNTKGLDFKGLVVYTHSGSIQDELSIEDFKLKDEEAHYSANSTIFLRNTKSFWVLIQAYNDSTSSRNLISKSFEEAYELLIEEGFESDLEEEDLEFVKERWAYFYKETEEVLLYVDEFSTIQESKERESVTLKLDSIVGLGSHFITQSEEGFIFVGKSNLYSYRTLRPGIPLGNQQDIIQASAVATLL